MSQPLDLCKTDEGGDVTCLIHEESFVDLVTRLDLAQHDAEHRGVLDCLRRALGEVRERRVTRVADESDVAVDPVRQWLVHAQLPLEDVALGDEVEELLHPRAKVLEDVEHLRLRPCRRPGVRLDETSVRVRRRHVKQITRLDGVGLRKGARHGARRQSRPSILRRSRREPENAR